MFGFRKKRSKLCTMTSATFVEATLVRARKYAIENEIPVGESFTFTITDIPSGISSPHEIGFGLMMRADAHGLAPGAMFNERITFTRTS